MTKVLPCYSLCPLIEQKSFLGVTPDAETDTVIVTTNSNIIGRYRISDPKQVSSWNSKGSISCSAVYDSGDRQYAAIFNRNEIRKWTSSDKSIDKVKKFKFSEKLYALSASPGNGKLLVVYEKGQVRFLDEAIIDRKTMFSSTWINNTEKILSCEFTSVSNNLIALLMVGKVNKTFKIIAIDVKQCKVIFDAPIHNGNLTLCSHCFITDKNCYFVSLWSDGKIYRDSLYPDPVTVPLNHIATVDDINLKQTVVMKALSPYIMAICGSKDDGLLLIMYSIKYNSIQCKQFYENCSNTPQLWSIHSKLFLILGHNLVVVPYVQENRKLSTLIGSNRQFDVNETSVLPESEICNYYLPLLLENDENEKIREMLEKCCDIPDAALLNIMMWSLKDMGSRRDILDVILINCCVNVNDVAQLRSVCSVDESLSILEYIMKIISDHDYNFKLFKWASLFIDTFYQQYVMADDKFILEKLNSYFRILMKEENYVNEFMQLASVLSCIQRKKKIFNQ